MESKKLATAIRRHSLRMVAAANASHIGTCLSMADLLGVLYSTILHVDPSSPGAADRDRFLLSKGHGAAALYSVLAEKGFFPREWLSEYCRDGSPLIGHTSHHVPGVELSTGSLGHALSVGCGLALAGLRSSSKHKVYVLLSDGELDEGSNWEAILFAGHHRLDNLVAIVDYNRIQSLGNVSEVLELEPLAEKWRAFHWNVLEVDGHDHRALIEAFSHIGTVRQPTVVIASTVKGKGVSFMQNELAWHYKSPNAEQLALALTELEQSA